MILPVHDRLRAHLSHCSARSTALDEAALPAIALEYPPNRELGDLGTPVAFELARRLRKAPRAIAQEIASAFGTLDGHPSGRGRPQRVPQRLSRPRRRSCSIGSRPAGLSRRRRRAPARPSSSTRRSTPTRRRTSATCATPRSATRSCACCASAASRSRSRTTSTTPASRSPTSSSASACSSGRRSTRFARSPTTTRFDYYCWDLYARVTEWYEQDKERLKTRAETLHDIEHGGNENAEIAAFIADRDRPVLT